MLVPRPSIEPVSPALDGGFLTTGPAGKSLHLLHFTRRCHLLLKMSRKGCPLASPGTSSNTSQTLQGFLFPSPKLLPGTSLFLFSEPPSQCAGPLLLALPCDFDLRLTIPEGRERFWLRFPLSCVYKRRITLPPCMWLLTFSLWLPH